MLDASETPDESCRYADPDHPPSRHADTLGWVGHNRAGGLPAHLPTRAAQTAAFTSEQVSARPHRRTLWAALGLVGAAACALIASMFVLLEGGAQTTGRGVPPGRAHVASTPTVVTTSTTPTTTTTTAQVTTTTAPKQHQGNSLPRQLHEEQRNTTLPPGPNHRHGGGREPGLIAIPFS